MTTYTCPAGHTSTASDYCDVCGAPIAASPAAPAPPVAAAGDPAAAPAAGAAAPAAGAAAPAEGGKPCPNCDDRNPPDALFCENCGYDFTTGQLPPAPAAPAPAPVAIPVDWVAEVWVDPDWYAHEASPGSTDPCPASGMPRVVPISAPSLLVGRTSASRNIHPDIDCGTDSGVSRRHAQLTLDSDHWYLEDLQSTNGTFVAVAGAPLPDDPLPPGQRHELGDNDRLYVGAWTRIVVRRATAEERVA